MASNYWESTQHNQWEDPTAESTGEPRDEDEETLFKQLPLLEPRLLFAYLQKRLQQLGKRLGGVRQIVLATAMVYIRRFYQRVQIRYTNPYLLIATAFYVASKIEETPHHVKAVLTEARNAGFGYMQPDVAKMGECEFRLISEMNAQLIIHHPYRHLGQLKEHLQLDEDAATIAWKVVNDHYLTDLPFRYPPHIIATMAVVLTVTPGLHQNAATSASNRNLTVSTGMPTSAVPVGSLEEVERLQQWLIQSDTVDVEAVLDCVQQMISLYVLLDQNPQADEKCKEQIARFVGAQRPDWAGGM